jgi:UDP-N-acetylglucosamine 3-dehydrogenase
MLRAAVIGVGAMGQHHARVYNELSEVELVAVADLSENAANRVAKLYKVPSYSSYEELLDAEDPDLVSIAVPTSLHHQTAIAVLEQGVHVLLEKPIASTLTEAQEIVRCAERSGLCLSVGHIERFNPAVVELKRRLDQGELGQVYQFHARRLSPYPDRVMDAGVVLDLAIHELDVMTCLDRTPIERLYAETRCQLSHQREDMLTGLLRFGSGVVGLLDINWLTPTKIRTLSVTGERGMFVVDYLLQDLVLYENTKSSTDGWGILEILGVGEGNVVKYRIPKMEPLKRELDAFVSAVAHDEPPSVTGEDGLRALRLALALVESAQTGEAVMDPTLSGSGAAVLGV